MATFTADPNNAFDMDTVDLNWYLRNPTESKLLKGVNSSILGRVFPDIYYAIGTAGGFSRQIDFGGASLTQDAAGAVTGGSVTGVAELIGDRVLWMLADFSTSAAALYKAALTTDPNDEKAIIKSILGGADSVSLSQQADHFASFGGGDTINGFGGDDIIESGDGDDTVYGGDGNDRIDPGLGIDRLFGEAGDDRFVFSSVLSTTTPTAVGLLDGGVGDDIIDLTAISPLQIGTIQNSAGQSVVGVVVGTQRFEVKDVEVIRLGPGGNTVNLQQNQLTGSTVFTGAGNDTITLRANSATIDAGDGDDRVILRSVSGTSSTAIVYGGNGTDTLDLNILSTVDLTTGKVTAGSSTWTVSGFERFIFSPSSTESKAIGDDADNDFSVSSVSDTGRAGVNVAAGGGNDRISGSAGADTLDGGTGNDIIDGGAGNDTLTSGGGSDTVNGGAGTDTLILAGNSTDYGFNFLNGTMIIGGRGDVIALSDVEYVKFDNVRIDTATLFSGVGEFDPLAYIASYPDLISAFGTNAELGLAHFLAYGAAGARHVSFDPLAYIASYPDLIATLGANSNLGLQHYILYGAADGRTTTFDPLAYIASYPDLIAAFGTNSNLGSQHYILYGAADGRTTTFNPLNYIASYPDLIRAFGADAELGSVHYILYGATEGRTTTFDPLAYIASYPDLIQAYGTDAEAGTLHWLQVGFGEGRQVTFDPLEYGAGYPDLIEAFGDDPAALTRHYLQYGYAEGRSATPGFDAVGYLLSNPDLVAANMDAEQALKHWLQFGFHEGRTYNPFGSDQTDHGATVGRVSAGTFAQVDDRDWYAVNVTAGQKLSLAVLQPDLVGSVVGGVGIKLYDAQGHLLDSATMTVDGFDHWFSFTSAKAGLIYVEVDANGFSGDYELAVAQVGRDYVPGVQVQPGASFTGSAGTDVFLGGNGSTTIDGGAGRDILGGGPGQDDFLGGVGADYMDGGSLIGADNKSTDSVSYLGSNAAVTAYLDGRPGIGGYAEGDRIFNVESLLGSRFADKLFGTQGDDSLQGFAGNDELNAAEGDDFLSGGDGADKLFGGAGNDRLIGAAGNDQIDGGNGFDTVDYQSSDAGVRVDLRTNAASGGDAQGDVLLNIESVVGSFTGNDILATSASSTLQSLFGNGGDDILIDRSTSSTGASLYGDAGNDLLVGAHIEGDDGNDTLVSYRENIQNRADGQAGADTYIIETSRNAAGTAFNFSLFIPSFDLSDKINLSQLRNGSGGTLTVADIQAHITGNVIDLTGFKTSRGDSVVGSIELDQPAAVFGQTKDFDTSTLTETNFLFSDASSWQSQIPSDFIIF